MQANAAIDRSMHHTIHWMRIRIRTLWLSMTQSDQIGKVAWREGSSIFHSINSQVLETNWAFWPRLYVLINHWKGFLPSTLVFTLHNGHLMLCQWTAENLCEKCTRTRHKIVAPHRCVIIKQSRRLRIECGIDDVTLWTYAHWRLVVSSLVIRRAQQVERRRINRFDNIFVLAIRSDPATSTLSPLAAHENYQFRGSNRCD